MFKATRNLVPEQFDRLTEDVGGFNNASTDDDYTNYYEVVPANHLAAAALGRGRADGLAGDRAGLLRLRARRGEGGAAQPRPRRALRQAVLPLSAADLLRRSSLRAARASAASRISTPRRSRTSAPSTPPITGPTMRCWSSPAISTRPSSTAGSTDISAPIARPATADPARDGARAGADRARAATPSTSRTRRCRRSLLAYPAAAGRATRTRRRSRCSTAILSTGESSRLHQSLVYRDQIASQASSFAEIKQGRGTLAAYAILAARQERRGRRSGASRARSPGFRDEPVTAAELPEAKNELLTAALRERETVDGQASALAEAVIVDGDPGRRRPAARRDRRGDRRPTSSASPRALASRRAQRGASAICPKRAQHGAREDTIATAATVADGGADRRRPTSASSSRRPKRERVAPPRARAGNRRRRCPRPIVQRLANGLTVITVEQSRLCRWSPPALVARGGAAADPDGQGRARRASPPRS